MIKLILVLLLTVYVQKTSLAQDQNKLDKIVCGFDTLNIPAVILAKTTDATDSMRLEAMRMFAYSGIDERENVWFAKSTSNALSYACIGFNKRGMPTMVINEENLKYLTEIEKGSVIVHEIGHFAHSHLYKGWATIAMELDADCYTGWWSAKNGLTSVDQILSLYQRLGVDKTHPPYEERKIYLEQGFIQGKETYYKTSAAKVAPVKDSLRPIMQAYKTFKLKNHFEGIDDKNNKTIAQKLFGKLDFIISVSLEPVYRKQHKGLFGKRQINEFYTSYLNVFNTDSAFINKESQILEKVDKVVYYIAEETFPTRLHYSESPENNFEYKLIIWGDDFPIVALIHFNDGSILPIEKTLFLKPL